MTFSFDLNRFLDLEFELDKKAELGDVEVSDEQLISLRLAPNMSPSLLARIKELHGSHRIVVIIDNFSDKNYRYNIIKAWTVQTEKNLQVFSKFNQNIVR